MDREEPRGVYAVPPDPAALDSSCSREGAAAPPTDALPPNTTSRCSVRHAVSVIKQFSEFKRWLVIDIGFGGMLDLPMIQKINLRLSSWCMSKVDVRRRALVINSRKILKFSSADVAMVFGIPSGNRDVLGPDGDINKESISFIKKTLGMDLSSSHSLRSAEEFLKRNITEESSKIEKDCFQIAFVIFIMGHVLAPSSKHDYKSIDFWGALANTENISQFNWCEYVLQCLLDAVSKLKMDIKNGVTTANLTGGHLFLQVFYMDNLDLGIFNKKHDMLPRIKAFDQESLRRMSTMATDVGVPEPSFSSAPLRDPSTVCYSRNCPEKETPSKSMSASHSFNATPLNRQSPAVTSVIHRQPSTTGQTLPTVISPRQFSALDYSNHISRHYPAMASQPLAVLLREQNARSIRHVTTARHNIQSDMLAFTDRLMAALAANCTCCSARGLSDCPLKRNSHDATEGHLNSLSNVDKTTATNVEATYRTPVSSKISGVMLEMSDCEGESSSHMERSAKRTRPSSSNASQEQSIATKKTNIQSRETQSRNEAICAAVQEYSRCISVSIKDLYADSQIDEPTLVFFDVNRTKIPRRKYISSRSYATNPWFSGRPVAEAQTHTAELLHSHLPALSAKHLDRDWLVHNDPRLVRVTGKDILNQLVGNAIIDHELGCMILRRQNQFDTETNPATPCLNHRHILELDFSTLALCGTPLSELVEVQNQFIGPNVQRIIEACQLFYIPAILRDGWALYIWDMLTRTIQVYDPSLSPKGSNQNTIDKHELIASCLHDALFACLNDFHAGWPTPKDKWSTVFPLFMDRAISREETGVCVMHIIRYHDGSKLRIPVTKNNLTKTKRTMLQEVMKLQGNNSSLPADALCMGGLPCFPSSSAAGKQATWPSRKQHHHQQGKQIPHCHRAGSATSCHRGVLPQIYFAFLHRNV